MASAGGMLAEQILGPHPRPTEPETVQGGSSSLSIRSLPVILGLIDDASLEWSLRSSSTLESGVRLRWVLGVK